MRGADERRLRRGPPTPQGGARRQRSRWAFCSSRLAEGGSGDELAEQRGALIVEPRAGRGVAEAEGRLAGGEAHRRAEEEVGVLGRLQQVEGRPRELHGERGHAELQEVLTVDA